MNIGQELTKELRSILDLNTVLLSDEITYFGQTLALYCPDLTFSKRSENRPTLDLNLAIYAWKFGQN